MGHDCIVKSMLSKILLKFPIRMKWTHILTKTTQKRCGQTTVIFSSVTKTTTSYNCRNLTVSVITKKLGSNDIIY